MMDILEEARDVLHQEAQGIEKLIPTLDQNFVNAVNLIMESHGRVIVTGMGKSGHIARKVAATLSSTGTPSIFLHPAEGIHGGEDPVRQREQGTDQQHLPRLKDPDHSDQGIRGRTDGRCRVLAGETGQIYPDDLQ